MHNLPTGPTPRRRRFQRCPAADNSRPFRRWLDIDLAGGRLIIAAVDEHQRSQDLAAFDTADDAYNFGHVVTLAAGEMLRHADGDQPF